MCIWLDYYRSIHYELLKLGQIIDFINGSRFLYPPSKNSQEGGDIGSVIPFVKFQNIRLRIQNVCILGPNNILS